MIRQPGADGGGFTVLALATYRLALSLPHETQRLAVIASRTSLIRGEFRFLGGFALGRLPLVPPRSWSR